MPALASLRRSLLFRFPVRYRIVWVALALLLIVVRVTSPQTLGSASIELVGLLAGVLMIASVGQLLVVMSAGIDLSVPAVMTLSGAIVVRRSQGYDDRLLGALVAVAVTAALIGLLNGVLVAVLGLNPIIVTLAMNGIVTGATLLWTGVTFSASGQVPPALHDASAASWGALSSIALTAVCVALVAAFVLRSTSIGRRFVAAGTNARAAEILGIRVRAGRIGAYVLAALLYATAGVLLAGNLRTPNYTLGSSYQLLTIVAVALAGASLTGGAASVIGVGAACFFLTLLDQYLAVEGVGGGTAVVLHGVVLLLAVAALRLAGWLRALTAWARRGGSASTAFEVAG